MTFLNLSLGSPVVRAPETVTGELASLGDGIGALALVVAITLPSPIVGAAPSVPGTTPGPNGAVLGRNASHE